jgi:hypothetical protein
LIRSGSMIGEICPVTRTLRVLPSEHSENHPRRCGMDPCGHCRSRGDWGDDP